MTWLILALLTAFFTSLHDVVQKVATDRKIDIYVIAWAWMFFSLPFLFGVLLFQGIPELGPSFWKAAAASTLFLFFAVILYVKAIKASDLSLTIPMLAFTPLFLLVTSPIMVGEFPTPIGVVGILLIAGGSYALNIGERSKGYLAPFYSLLKEKGTRYMLVVAVLFSIAANIDKIGVNNSSPVMWITAINTCLAAAFFFVVLRKVDNIKEHIKEHWFILVMIGLLNAVALIFHMLALQLALVPYVIAIKRLSAFFSSIFGFMIFKEKGIKERTAGALLMVLGAALISFSS